MDKSELKILVSPYMIGSTVTEITEQDEFYIVYFVNNEYYETKDPLQMLVGAGPLLVNKKTRNVFETGSGQVPSYCIESYHKTGSINSTPSNILLIRSLSSSINKSESILLVKKLCDLNMTCAKEIVEKALAEIETKIEMESEDKTKETENKLNLSGFHAEQLWK